MQPLSISDPVPLLVKSQGRYLFVPWDTLDRKDCKERKMSVSNNTLNSQAWLSCHLKCSALKKVCEKSEHFITTNYYACHISIEWLNTAHFLEQNQKLTALLSDALTDCLICFSVQEEPGPQSVRRCSKQNPLRQCWPEHLARVKTWLNRNKYGNGFENFSWPVLFECNCTANGHLRSEDQGG